MSSQHRAQYFRSFVIVLSVALLSALLLFSNMDWFAEAGRKEFPTKTIEQSEKSGGSGGEISAYSLEEDDEVEFPLNKKFDYDVAYTKEGMTQAAVDYFSFMGELEAKTEGLSDEEMENYYAEYDIDASKQKLLQKMLEDASSIEILDSTTIKYGHGADHYTSFIMTAPYFYKERGGDWKVIDNRVRAEETDRNGVVHDYGVKRNTVRSFFNVSNAGFRIERGNLSFDAVPMGLDLVNNGQVVDSQPIQVNNHNHYDNRLRIHMSNGDSIEYVSMPGKALYNHVVGTFPFQNQLNVGNITNSSRIQLKEQFVADAGCQFVSGGNALNVTGPQVVSDFLEYVCGSEKIMLTRPYAYEHGGHMAVDDYLLGDFIIESLGNNTFEITHDFPVDWFLDVNRQYPVVIDPTTYHSGDSYENGHVSHNTSAYQKNNAWNFPSEERMRIENTSSSQAGDTRRGFFKGDLSSLQGLSNLTINSADLHAWMSDASTCSGDRINFLALNSDTRTASGYSIWTQTYNGDYLGYRRFDTGYNGISSNNLSNEIASRVSQGWISAGAMKRPGNSCIDYTHLWSDHWLDGGSPSTSWLRPVFQVNYTAVTNRPDLTRQSNAINGNNFNLGDDIDVDVRVVNNGTAHTGSSSVIKFYLQPGTTPSYSSTYETDSYGVSPLAVSSTSNESASYTIPTTLSPGTYTMAYWIDANQSITESNENNNRFYWTITINGISGDVYENDDTCPTATNLPIGGTQNNHSIHTIGNQDWVKFQVTTTPIDIVIATNGPVNEDTEIYLYDGCNGNVGANQLDWDDRDGPGSFSLINYTLNNTGWYYVLAIEDRNDELIPNYSISVSGTVVANNLPTVNISNPGNGYYTTDTSIQVRT